MRYLGLDLGTRTLGVSMSDTTLLIATPFKNIRFNENDYESLIPELTNIIENYNISKIVLGLPKNMNGSLGFRAEETIEFKEKLEKEVSIDIYLEDERLTTRLATDTLIKADISREKRKKVIDGVSAVVILQGYLDKKE